MPGKKGNTNALKHGLYAKRFTDDDRKGLAKMPETKLVQEIAALRVIGDQILALLKDHTDHVDETAKLANVFCTVVIAIGTTARTEALLNGAYNPLDDALEKALDAVPPYADDEPQP